MKGGYSYVKVSSWVEKVFEMLLRLSDELTW